MLIKITITCKNNLPNSKTKSCFQANKAGDILQLNEQPIKIKFWIKIKRSQNDGTWPMDAHPNCIISE